MIEITHAVWVALFKTDVLFETDAVPPEGLRLRVMDGSITAVIERLARRRLLVKTMLVGGGGKR